MDLSVMRSARGCRSKACDAAAIRARVEEIRAFAGPSLPILPITFGDDVDAKDCGQRLQFEGVEDAPLVLGYSGESAGAQMFVADMWGNAEVQRRRESGSSPVGKVVAVSLTVAVLGVFAFKFMQRQ